MHGGLQFTQLHLTLFYFENILIQLNNKTIKLGGKIESYMNWYGIWTIFKS